jgi:hypothetical protein
MRSAPRGGFRGNFPATPVEPREIFFTGFTSENRAA